MDFRKNFLINIFRELWLAYGIKFLVLTFGAVVVIGYYGMKGFLSYRQLRLENQQLIDSLEACAENKQLLNTQLIELSIYLMNLDAQLSETIFQYEQCKQYSDSLEKVNQLTQQQLRQMQSTLRKIQGSIYRMQSYLRENRSKTGKKPVEY